MRHRPRSTFAELISDAPASERQQPALKGAACRVGFKFVDGLRHPKQRFLLDIFGFRFGQPRLNRDTQDEARIGFSEFLPTGLVFPVLEPAEQACAGGDRIVAMSGHDVPGVNADKIT